ncbi:MAG: hypothetical protein U1F52_01320 [Burkholderiales bacterium]
MITAAGGANIVNTGLIGNNVVTVLGGANLVNTGWGNDVITAAGGRTSSTPAAATTS